VTTSTDGMSLLGNYTKFHRKNISGLESSAGRSGSIISILTKNGRLSFMQWLMDIRRGYL